MKTLQLELVVVPSPLYVWRVQERIAGECSQTAPILFSLFISLAVFKFMV